MASFIGTNKEFRRYLGPRLRNLVQQFTKKHKMRIAICEHCGTNKNLESAHVHGRDRNEIIDNILTEYTNNNIITIDINEFEGKFINEHIPIEKSILILCRPCHKKYDSLSPTQSSRTQLPKNPSASDNQDYLPITLDPPSPDAFKQELLYSKQAIIETTYSDGRVEEKKWNATRFSQKSNVIGNLRSRPEFRSKNWKLKGIIKVHVRIIRK